jgi:hypothetical protein
VAELTLVSKLGTLSIARVPTSMYARDGGDITVTRPLSVTVTMSPGTAGSLGYA